MKARPTHVALTLLAAATTLAISTAPAAAASQGLQRTRVLLVSTGVDPDAKGKIDLLERPSRTRFKVEVQRLTPGTAELSVGGTVVGTITVRSTGRGQINFRAPVGDDPGALPLTFDPHTQAVTVSQNGQVVLQATVPAKTGGSGTVTDVRIETRLQATDALPGAKGRARFRINGGVTRFDVQIERVPVGTYALRVGGNEVASIIATLAVGDNSAQGEVEFSSKVEAGKLSLTFEPRGQLVEVLSGGTVILSEVLPLP